MFQFPNWSIELPGRTYAGNDPDGFSHKNEVLKLIEDFSAWIKAPLRLGVNVLSLRSSANASRYLLVTDRGNLGARNVVIATGPYQRSRVPQISSSLPGDLVQLHASEYRNPGALPAGAVLVVGSGASGCQIAEELVEAGRRVYFSVGRHCRVPRRYRGRDVFWWRRALGHLDQTIDTTPLVQRMPAPLVTGVDGGHDIDIRRYAANGMTLLGKVRDVCDGRVALASDLEGSLRVGDQTFDDFKLAVDSYVRKSGIEAPPAQDKAGSDPVITAESIGEIDVRVAKISSVIWATGYALDFGWVELPIFDALGQPVHRRGVTAAPGTYLLGLAWLHKPKSSFLYGVGEDAEYLAERISYERG
jgi:putative flavoprotein involved in K+ transport